MKKIYFLLLLSCLSFAALSQTTVSIYATTGADESGYTTAAGPITYGNIETSSGGGAVTARRGFAVFSLSSIPAGATITSCTINFSITAVTGGATAASETYGYPGDLSTVTTAATLYADCLGGTALSGTAYDVAAGDQTLGSSAAATTFIQDQIGNTISICWTGGGSRIYTMTGEAGAETTTDPHAPYLSVTYCAPPTAVTATASPTAICAGGTLNLTATATGATSYSWAGPGGYVSATQDPALTPTASGIYTVTATNLCGTATATATAATAYVTVNTLPAAIAGGTNVCTGEPIALSDATSGGTWSSSNTTVATITSGGVAYGVGAGTSIITYTLGTGCTDTMTVTDNTPPDAITGNTPAMCVGNTMDLADATSGGTWSSSLASVATVSTGGVVGGVASGSVNISYTVATGCYSDIAIMVDALPAPIAGDSNICTGLSTTLTDATSGGAWSSSNTGVATVSSGGTVYGVATGTSIITYSLGTGCSDTMTVTTYQTPANIVGSASIICTGTTLALTESTTGGSWISSSAAVATVSTSGVVTAVAGGSVVISYVMPSGCYALVNIIVNPSTAPDPITGATSECQGANTTLHEASGSGDWSSSNSGIAQVYPDGVVYGISAGTAVITFTSPSTNCSVTTLMTVVATPPAITGTLSECLGATITLSDATSGGVWSSVNTAVATIDPVAGTVYGVTLGTTLISYTVPPGCPVMAIVTINPLPDAITGSAVVCTGSTTTLADASSGGTWSTATTTYATIGETTGVVTGVADGATAVTYTLPTGCIATSSIVDEDPPAALTNGDTAVCVGVEFTLGEASTGAGTWTSSNTAVATVDGTGDVFGAGAGTTSIVYTSSSTCSAATTVTVNALPVAIGGNASICTGFTTTLTDATTGGTWSSSTTTVATIDSLAGTVTGVTDGTSIITYTTSTGCTTTLTVTDTDPPAALTGGDTAICSGVTITLGETSTAAGTWTSSNTTIATVDGTGDVSGEASGAANILFTLASGCYASTSVTVNPLPAAIGSSSADVVCTGSTIDLTETSTGGTWSSSATTVATIDSVAGSVLGVAAGTAVITYTLPTGCITDTTVTDDDPPGAISTTTSVICPLTNTTYTETSTGGTWSSSNTAVATVDPVAGIVYGVAGGTANISYTLPGGCYQFAPVTVNPAPNAIFGLSSVCTGNTITLTESSIDGSWSSSDPTIASVDGSGDVTGEGAGTATISYTFTATGCFALDTITDNDPPGTIGAVTSMAVCAGSSIGLTESSTSGTWSSQNNSIATVDANGNVYGVFAGVVNISYTLPSGCYNTASVTVNPLPDAIIGATSICTGSTTTLTDGSSGGSWSSQDQAIASIDPSGGVVTGEGSGTTTISFTITATGCYVTSPMTDNDPPVAIIGQSQVCQLATIGLSESTAGGTWQSSDNGVATVDGSGNVTGVTAGDVNISYTVTATGCYVTDPITVNPIPAAITGDSTVCLGGTTLLSEANTDGTWNTSNSGIASIDGTGTVYGINAGTATISYIISATGCYVTTTASVNIPPTAIVGSSPICIGGTVTFTDPVANGVWSSEFPLIAVANPATGAIFGSEAGNDTIYYTVTACPAASFPITVNPAPTPISGPNTVCTGSMVTLSEATPGGFWASGDPGLATIDTSGDVFGQSPGVVTINYTIGGCAPASYQMTVYLTPTAISGLSQVCATFTTNLSDGITGGTWTSSTPSVASVNSAGNVLGVSAGTSVITYMLPGGCYQTLLFTVNALPANITYPTNFVCQGSSIIYNEDSTTGMWSSSNTFIATVGTGSGIITGVAAGTANIIYTLPTGCFKLAEVSVNPLPLASTGPDMGCVDATITLVNSSPGGPGTWSTSDPSVATVTLTSGVVSGVSPGTTSITFSLPTGCNTSATVTINALPDAIFGLSQVCAGSSIILSDLTPGGSWSSTGGAASVVAGTGVVNGLTAGVSNVSYTVTSTGCSAVTPVTVNPLPAAITGPITVCDGATITLLEGDTGGSWSSSDITIATVGSATGVVTGVGVGAIDVLYTFPSGCSTGLSITANSSPAASVTTSGATAFCAGGSVLLTASAGVYSYQWYNDSVAIPTAIGATYSATSSGSYYVVITNATSCSAASDTVNVSDGIFPILSDTGAISLCAGNSLTISVSSGGAVGTISYVWLLNGNPIPGASDVSYVITAAGTYEAQLTVSGGSGLCQPVSDDAVVTVNPLPHPSISFDGSALSTSSGYLSYQWFLNTVGIPGATDSTYVPAIDGSYRVLVVDSQGCDGYSNAYAVANVGVKQVNAEQIRIYPNPATSIVNVEAPMVVRAVITSVDGKELMNIQNAKAIDISSLASGLYLIQIYDGDNNQLLLEKLIKD